MATVRKDEERYLSADERDLVARTHQPALGEVADQEFAKMRRLLRERRDRARDIAARQRREIRGKQRASGAEPTRDDAGSRMKLSILSQAMKRLNREGARRNRRAGREATAEGMRQALERKKDAEAATKRPATRTARKGMKAKPNTDTEGATDPGEIGRMTRSTKKAQA